ncbi:PPE domain-containing protein [Nocardia stercoris]|uniref:PPE domain-containing protein n=1 Tax=Nocardia stercoris TaxID=2483361 RepID=A0A3M2LC73_9NOCA|nr:PPE domain-containing protein [Nocardia stercoris]RMI34183.1 PPE domain-containing protein [Nocardia stercoris]
MAFGVTGVYWLARLAEGNSAALNAGTHGASATAAAGAWGGLATSWTEATATVGRIMAELGIGLAGENGDTVAGKLTSFTGWAGQQSAMAAAMSAKATAHATAYTVASIAMPSMPEILTADATRATAHALGGDLTGAAEAAEAAKAALDVQAAAVMETYETATDMTTSTPNSFEQPPSVAQPGGAVEAAADAAPTDPIQAAIAAGQALLSDPTVAAALSQAGQVLGGVAPTVVSTAGTVATGGISNVVSMLGAAGPLGGLGMAPAVTAGTAVGAGAVTTAASYLGGSSTVSIGNNAGALRLPAGWGTPDITGGGATSAATPQVQVTTAPAQPGAGTPARAATTGTGGNPLLGRGHADEEEDGEHKGKVYRQDTSLTDQNMVAAGVIGADLTAEDA